jgi:AcrR family transcriptional regulator
MGRKVAIDLLLRKTAAQVLTFGVSRIEVKAIALELNVTLPAIYYYFENKGSLIEEALLFRLKEEANLLTEIVLTLTRQVAPKSNSPEKAIKLVLNDSSLQETLRVITKISSILPPGEASKRGEELLIDSRRWCDENPIPFSGNHESDSAITNLLFSSIASRQSSLTRVSDSLIVEMCRQTDQ